MPRRKKKIPDPDETTMSLGDHLEELRARLILAIMGLLLGTIVALICGKYIIRFIERPYLKVVAPKLAKPEQKDKADEPNDTFTAFCNALAVELASDPNAPDIDPNIVTFIKNVYVKVAADQPTASGRRSARSEQEHVSVQLQTLAPADGFVSYMKISLIAGLILSAPWVFYQLWMFVAAGLYPHERRYVHVAVPFSTVLFVTGALFFLFVVAPLALRFLIAFNKNFLGVYSHFTFQNYISFVTLLMLVFGLAFQTPIAIFILTRTGLVSIPMLKSARKFVVLGVFVVAAIATPPDVISQVTLAIPLYLLFELGILLSWLADKRKKNRQDKEPAPDEPDVY